MEQPVPYCAYLIRLWPTKRRGVAGRRVSVQCVATDQHKELPDLDRLVAFLRAPGEAGPNQECQEDGSDRRAGRPAPQR